MDLAAGLPPATRRSKRRMMVISPREGKWSLHEDLHLDFRLRGPASWLLDDEGKMGPPPESHRPCPVYKTGPSLATSGGHLVAAPGNAPGPGAHLARFRL